MFDSKCENRDRAVEARVRASVRGRGRVRVTVMGAIACGSTLSRCGLRWSVH